MVVEAKLVTPDGLAILLFTEFVENTGDDSKQDCELKAFYRIAAKINAHFPGLPVMVTIEPLAEVARRHSCESRNPVFSRSSRPRLSPG